MAFLPLGALAIAGAGLIRMGLKSALGHVFSTASDKGFAKDHVFHFGGVCQESCVNSSLYD